MEKVLYFASLLCLILSLLAGEMIIEIKTEYIYMPIMFYKGIAYFIVCFGIFSSSLLGYLGYKIKIG